jgi:ketosteroid isomerase-like protein
VKTATEALERFFAAINCNDLTAITEEFHPEIVRIEPEGFPTAGTYRGVREVQEHITKGRGTWAEGSCDPERFLMNGDRVVVYLYVWSPSGLRPSSGPASRNRSLFALEIQDVLAPADSTPFPCLCSTLCGRSPTAASPQLGGDRGADPR